MLAPTERPANCRPSPLPLPSLLAAELGPAVMADDPCEAAFPAGTPTGPRNYYRARYYDPKIGRFISEDPIRFLGGDINLYAYVWNRPTTLVDPEGLIGRTLPAVTTATPPGNLLAGAQCIQGVANAGGLGVAVLLGWFPNRDKVAHCLAHCELVKGCGPGLGGVMSSAGGPGKEGLDHLFGSAARAIGLGGTLVGRQKWDPGDEDANRRGASCPATQSCFERCANAPN